MNKYLTKIFLGYFNQNFNFINNIIIKINYYLNLLLSFFS